MTAAILTEDLTKFYGSTRGIEALDLEVRAGEVFGYLGPNGAGKSTTIRTLLDFIRPTRGRAAVLGLDSSKDYVAIHRRVGYVPGELAMYEKMTGAELIRYFGNLRGFDAWDRVDRLADRLDLDLGVTIRSYSSGNRQKVALVQALMHEPELLVLDEPTNALDPLMQQEFYRMVREITAEGRTVFLSSHILPEVERIADRVGIIRDGHLVVVESVGRLKERALRSLELRFGEPVSADEFSSLDGVRDVSVNDGGRVVRITVEGSVDAVVKAAARHPVTNVISHEGDLEEAFMAFYSGENDDAR